METNQQALPHGYVLQGEKNRYVIDCVLGQGSFGITYLAKCKTTFSGSMGTGTSWTQVAVKEFFMRDLNTRDGSTGFLNDSSQDSIIGKYRRAFVREARNLARLSHPGIVNVFEVIETNNTVYIVMEYIDGGSLDEYISSKGRLTERESLTMFCGICSAVGFMHQHRMLHLDLKPKNIMLDEERHPLLIDFGLSKQYTENGEPESSTSIGLGTPGYAPIEQAERTDSDTSFRPAIDIYALGATLYKMLTGSTPPLASKVSESVLEGENLIPSTLKGQGISDSTAALVTKAMWPSSRKRYQSTAEIITAIDGILQEQGKGNAGSNPAGEETVVKNPGEATKPHTQTAYADRSLFDSKPGNKIDTKSRSKVDIRPTHDRKAKPSFISSLGEPVLNTDIPKWVALIILIIGILIMVFLCFKYQSINKSTTKKQDNTSVNSKPSVSTGNGTSDGHVWVDLGLSVKWATCNIGATKPEDYGEYYAWGETNAKSDFKWTNYTHSVSSSKNLTKYCNKSNYGDNKFTDHRTKLENSDDVATQRWGSSWRMPTDGEIQELIDNCTWTWTTLNHVQGYVVTSNKSGYTYRSIFLPAAGYRSGTNLFLIKTNGRYWTSTLDTSEPYHARCLTFSSVIYYINTFEREEGRSVRPVCP